MAASGVIFFAYIGFDAVSTTAQEARNPQRDMPIGILGSLVICTILYILVSGIMTGIVDYPRLNVAEPIAVAIEATGYVWIASLVKVGAIAGLTSVMLVMLMAQPRIFFTMSRDGLLPPVFGRLHPTFRTPWISTLLTGASCAALAGLFDVSTLGHLVSIGTLLAFVIVCDLAGAGAGDLLHLRPPAQRGAAHAPCGALPGGPAAHLHGERRVTGPIGTALPAASPRARRPGADAPRHPAFPRECRMGGIGLHPPTF